MRKIYRAFFDHHNEVYVTYGISYTVYGINDNLKSTSCRLCCILLRSKPLNPSQSSHMPVVLHMLSTAIKQYQNINVNIIIFSVLCKYEVSEFLSFVHYEMSHFKCVVNLVVLMCYYYKDRYRQQLRFYLLKYVLYCDF